MKKLTVLFLILMMSVLFAQGVFATEQINPDSMLSLNILKGPSEYLCGETLVTIDKDSVGVNLGSSLLADKANNIQKFYTMITKNEDVYLYNYLRTGYFKNISLTKENILEMFNGKSENKTYDITFMKDNTNRYFIKSVETATDKTEYVAVTFFRKGVGFLSIDYPDSTNSEKRLMDIINFSKAINAKLGEEYTSWIKGDKESTLSLKEYFTIFFGVNDKKLDNQSVNNASILSALTPSDSKLTKAEKQQKDYEQVEAAMVKTFNEISNRNKGSETQANDILPLVQKDKNTYMWVIGVLSLLLAGGLKFMDEWRKENGKAAFFPIQTRYNDKILAFCNKTESIASFWAQRIEIAVGYRSRVERIELENTSELTDIENFEEMVAIEELHEAFGSDKIIEVKEREESVELGEIEEPSVPVYEKKKM